MSNTVVSGSRSEALRPVAWWILFGAFCNCAGWLLSALHWLNATGYVLAFVFGLGAVVAFRRRLLPAGLPRLNLPRLRRRFGRLFPLAFLTLAFLALLGGVLYPPANVDALVQRIPRVLNWLAEGRWHWIPNATGSFNSHANGFEWLMAPMIALLRTDRWLFLYNAVSYLLMPGLVFSVLTRLGVRPRAAWHWMWLAPTGYCFLLQAGGIGNDALGAVLALAAVDFALRAKTSRAVAEVWLSMLAVGLLTAFKTSNLTLLLPWLIALWPSLPLLWRRPFASFGVGAAAALASFLPMAAANYSHSGDWTGAAKELPPEIKAASPGVVFVGNALNLAAQTFTPPVFPAAGWWNAYACKVLPPGLATALEHGFEGPGAHVELSELQWETNAGLGVGLALLLLLSWAGARSYRNLEKRSALPPTAGQGHLALVRWSPWVCLLVFMLKLPLWASGRILAPYYCLFLPCLLHGPGQAALTRRRWWKGCAVPVFLLALIPLLLNPPRPLWPAQRVLSLLAAWRPESRPVKLGKMLYYAQAVRWDALAEVRSALPPEAKEVGFIPYVVTSTLETSLWRPFNHRRIRWLPPEESLEGIASRRIRYVVIDTDSLTTSQGGVQFQDWFDAWLRSHQGKIVREIRVQNVATKPPYYWYVVQLPPGPAGAAAGSKQP